MKRLWKTLLSAALCVVLTPAAGFAQSDDELRSAAQNPLANIISLPFQNNTDFGIGPHDRTKNTLNIQPVLPYSVGSWTMMKRIILPVVYQPDVAADSGGEWGLGDTLWTAWFAPPPKKFTWGVGPATLIPTSTKDETGAGEWGFGPSLVVVAQPKGWTVGGLINNVWSIDADEGKDINIMTLQPFVNYNLPKSWYLTFAPIVTANWEADSGNQWTVPVGGGVGKLFSIGRQPVNSQLATYYNVEKPEGGADWQLRVMFQFLIPKK